MKKTKPSKGQKEKNQQQGLLWLLAVTLLFVSPFAFKAADNLISDLIRLHHSQQFVWQQP